MLNYERIYQFRFQGIDPEVKAAVWSRIAPWIWNRMGRPQTIIDPAAGMMEFLRFAPAKEKWGVDLMKPAFDFASASIQFRQGSIFEVSLEPGKYDGVFVSNFLEHLHTPEEIQTLLERLFAAMKPGGQVAIMGPNFKYCTSEYFDCADHRLALSDVAVSEHLYSAGFEIVESIPRFLPYSFRGKLPPSPFLVGMYLNMPFAWRILGKQFLILARKP